MKPGLSIVVMAIGGLTAAVALAQQKIDDTHDFQPGDLISLGANSYPAGGVYRIASCELRDKPYRQCQVYRVAPDQENHQRSLVMNNYNDGLTLVGRVDPPAAAPVRAPAASAPPLRQPPTGTQPAQVAAAGERCTPATPYTGAIPATRPPSAALFREIIANKFTVDGNAQYPRRIDYLNFSVGAPTVNTVGRTNQGANRVTNGAPADVQLYPITTSFTVCKAEWTKANRHDFDLFMLARRRRVGMRHFREPDQLARRSAAPAL